MTENDLKYTVKKLMEDQQLDCKIKSNIRNTIINTLVDFNAEPNNLKSKSITDNENTCIALEMIREFLDWAQLPYTTDILENEAGLNKTKRSRKDILKVLSMEDTSETIKLPVLLTIITSAMNKN